MDNLNALGLGSGGQLSGELLTSLKEADEAMQLSPIHTKIAETDVKIDKLSVISSSFSDLSQTIKELSTPEYYDYLYVDGNNSIDINIKEGAVPNDFSMNVTQIARKDVFQSNVFATDTQATLTDQNITVQVGFEPPVNVFVPAGSTYAEVGELISSLDGIEATVLKVSDLEFRLTLSSTGTGAGNAISIISEDAELAATFGFSDVANHVQTAQDSQFTYNGLAMSRSENTFSDLLTGVEIVLRTVGDNNVSMTPDAEALTSTLQTFVDNYNTLASVISENSVDPDTDKPLFQASRELREVFRTLNKQLFEPNANMMEKGSAFTSILDAGIVKNRDGSLSIGKVNDQTLLQIATENFFELKDLFTNIDTDNKLNNGIFQQVLSAADSISNDAKTGTLNAFAESLENSADRLDLQLERRQKKIDVQYEIMQMKFASFDSIINNMTSAFSSLKMQIDQSTASPNG